MPVCILFLCCWDVSVAVIPVHKGQWDLFEYLMFSDTRAEIIVKENFFNQAQMNVTWRNNICSTDEWTESERSVSEKWVSRWTQAYQHWLKKSGTLNRMWSPGAEPRKLHKSICRPVWPNSVFLFFFLSPFPFRICHILPQNGSLHRRIRKISLMRRSVVAIREVSIKRRKFWIRCFLMYLCLELSTVFILRVTDFSEALGCCSTENAWI